MCIRDRYNGLPWGCEDNEFPWEVREGDLYETKYPYVVHAELNAILNSTGQLKGCRIYVSLFPCHECFKAIIQSGIKEIVYEDDKYSDCLLYTSKGYFIILNNLMLIL